MTQCIRLQLALWALLVSAIRAFYLLGVGSIPKFAVFYHVNALNVLHCGG